MYYLFSLKSHPIDAIKPAVLGTVFPKRPITTRPEKDADGWKCQHVQYISVHHGTIEKSGICNMKLIRPQQNPWDILKPKRSHGPANNHST